MYETVSDWMARASRLPSTMHINDVNEDNNDDNDDDYDDGGGGGGDDDGDGDVTAWGTV